MESQISIYKTTNDTKTQEANEPVGKDPINAARDRHAQFLMSKQSRLAVQLLQILQSNIQSFRLINGENLIVDVFGKVCVVLIAKQYVSLPCHHAGSYRVHTGASKMTILAVSSC